MEEFFCEYCKHSFKTATVLKNHQRRTKYCIDIQQKLNINIVKDLKKCIHCLNDFSPHLMNRHLLTCKVYKENIINELLEKNKQLEMRLSEKDLIILKLETELNIVKEEHKEDKECIKEIAKQTKTKVTNNTTNKILNLTPLDLSVERIKDVIQSQFDHNYVSGGQKGVAEFAKEKLLTDDDGNLNYVCTDFDRKVFKYKDDSGEVRKDTKAKKLTNKLVKAGLMEKNQDTTQEWCSGRSVLDGKHLNDKMAEINNIENDNTNFVKELSAITVP